MEASEPHTAAVAEPRGAEQPRDGFTFRFDDGYWDDAFATLYDPSMRVCSVFGC